MANQPGVWGIDLGQCGLKAVRLQDIDGQVTATAFDYVEHPKILSQPDADPDQLTREALEKFLSRNSLRGDQVCISVPGQSGLARFVKPPPPPPSPASAAAASSPWTSAPTAPTWSSPTARRSSGSGPSRWAATTSPAP